MTRSDEQAVRQVIDDWMTATAAEDVDKISTLMTEDVVFLIAGHEPIRGRKTFIDGQREMFKHVSVEVKSDIKEIQVSGTLAYCWNHLTVNVQPKDGGAAVSRSGFVLSVMKKNPAGEWQLYRDANLLEHETGQ
jgi:uncharacterized protein (TIGR02246 family)